MVQKQEDEKQWKSELGMRNVEGEEGNDQEARR
jgi:hypothetical protein